MGTISGGEAVLDEVALKQDSELNKERDQAMVIWRRSL